MIARVTHLATRAALCALALTLCAAAPAAAQTDPIEAIWSFSGGQVAVERQADGTFVGTIIRRTAFSHCVHENGEQMWTDIRPQPDGQYFGRHQFFNASDCTFTDRANIALRPLRDDAGRPYLRVCFSKPETPTVQPSIAPDGTETATTDDCADSDLVAALPTTTPKLKDIVTLPRQTKSCASRRKFPIRLKEPIGDALESATVKLNKKSLRVVRRNGRLTSSVDLRGLPRGRYHVRIVAKTVRGRTISGARRYRTCGKVRRIGKVGPI